MRKVLVLIAIMGLASCEDGDKNLPPADLPSIAETSDIRFQGSEAGVTPFISFVHLEGQRVPAIRSVTYVVEPKPGSVSNPVRVTYTLAALKSRGRLMTKQLLDLPVFGLYAGFANSVSIELRFADDSAQTIACTVTTDPYTDPNGVYDNPAFIRNRAAGSALGFDFFAIKSSLGTPIVIDTDGAVRWVGVGSGPSNASVFTNNGFVVGDVNSTRVDRLELDGTVSSTTLAPQDYIYFHHNLGLGKTGLLGELSTLTDFESTIAEFTMEGGFSRRWDFAAIVGDHMRNGGDDASLFVRPGFDWFHSNASTYDSRDDSLIVSSRENFVIKVDYDTGEIIWILGDPAKHWWTFPSLRAKALALNGPGLYPIGQHAVSITSSGLLLLFNNGLESANQPASAPRGDFRLYSAVSAYRIDTATMTATEVWSFDYGQSVYSPICSSAYEAPDQSVLISYARVDAGTHARLVGLDSQHQVVFDFQYDNPAGCSASWNAVPIPFENLSFM